MFTIPGPTQRACIVGRTGSGKSQLGAWLLANSSYDVRPFVIIDYKGEQLYRSNRLKGVVNHLTPTSKAPKKKGLYIVNPRPDEDEEMEDFMWRIWERGNTGILVDEGYMLPDKGAFRSLVTQGRSKKIPMIILSQRPVYMNRFVFSEADYYALFRLNDDRDYKTITAFMPKAVNPDEVLPPYYSWWYNVAKDKLNILTPCPSSEIILDTICRRAPRPWWS